MASTGFDYGASSFQNPYTARADALNTTMPALMNIINSTANQAQQSMVPPSPMEEHKAFLRELSVETRSAIESSEEYQSKKLELLQNFLIWCIGGTELGNMFCSGPGAQGVRDLTAIAKDLEPKVGKRRDAEVEDLKNTVAQLQQALMQRQQVSIGQAQGIPQEFMDEMTKLRDEVQALRGVRSELENLKRDLGGEAQ